MTHGPGPIIRAVIIYLACTVRGDRRALAAARALAEKLESAGHTVLTKHLLEDDVEGLESALTEREVFERDLRLLETADLLVAEASGSSYGVGFEVGYVLGRAGQTGQRVLLLFDRDRHGAVSRLISGNSHPACATYAYAGIDDMLEFLAAALAPARG